ncbi:MAG: hypothetical protein HOV80_22065 [Polyangiaceae bacterium]|nr:hypothetical protein [Polyangiaceae bacterium]
MKIAGLTVPSLVKLRGHRRALGEPVPHGEDWWISTDDAKDYGAWVNRRVDDTAARFGLARAKLTLSDYGPYGDPVSERALKFHQLEGEWIAWEYNWKQFYAGVTDSWWARVNSWDTIRTRHAELIDFRARLKALNMGVEIPAIAGLPSDGPSPGDVGGGIKKTLDKLGTGVVIAVVVGVAIVAWRTTK